MGNARTRWLQETKQMRFLEAYQGWYEGRLSQEEAAQLLGVSSRSFRRYMNRYHDEGLEGLLDKRLNQVSHLRAPVDEVMRLEEQYSSEFDGWTVRHFYSHYRREGGSRSYGWVKNVLQSAGLVKKKPKRGKHRKRREPSPVPGLMIHQDGSTHEWVEGCKWDLIVTMDDATNEHYSMFFVDEEGTQSSFRGVQETIDKKGLFCSFYSDRGSHYWHTPVAGGKVDTVNLTQFGRAMKELGVHMIPAYSPEARGRSERAFGTHQDRLTKELKREKITTLDAANHYIQAVYLPRFNAEFKRRAREEGSAFIPMADTGILREILCEKIERTVSRDNCVAFDGMTLQIPKNPDRWSFHKAKVVVHRYPDRTLSVFYGPRCIGRYNTDGSLISEQTKMTTSTTRHRNQVYGT